MTASQWDTFVSLKKQFFDYCESFNQNARYKNVLTQIQYESAKNDTPNYVIENPLVYNTDLDKITSNSNIKLILIADNPGKNEQLSVNKKYLIGHAGILGRNFFLKHRELGIDYDNEVLVLNKTPLHSAKTKHLISIEKSLRAYEEPLKNLILDSQLFMADLTAKFFKCFCDTDCVDKTNTGDLQNDTMGQNTTILQNHAKVGKVETPCKIFLIGYSELKNNGIFVPYKNFLQRALCDKPEDSRQNANHYSRQNATSQDYRQAPSLATNYSRLWDNVFVYQHFSMNRFSIDFKNFCSQNPQNSLEQNLYLLGKKHKDEIFSI